MKEKISYTDRHTEETGEMADWVQSFVLYNRERQPPYFYFLFFNEL